MLSNSTFEFKSEIKLKDTNEIYDFFVTYNNSQFYMKLTKYLDANYWEINFELSKLQLDYKFLFYFETYDDFIVYIMKSCNEKTVALSKTSENAMILSFQFMDRSFSVFLKNKIVDISENFKEITNLLQKSNKQIQQSKFELEQQMNTIKIEMDKKFQVLEEKIDFSLKKIMLMFEEIKEEKIILKKINEDNQNKKIVCPDFSFVPSNNNGNFKLDNNNKTLEKISGKNRYRGFRCEPPGIISPKMGFSVKIDCNMNSHFMIGWCLKNGIFSSGYHNSNSAFCFSFEDGRFFRRENLCISQSLNQTPIFMYIKENFSGDPNNIYSSVINLKKREIVFYENECPIGFPRSISLSEAEIPLLCPFIDTDRIQNKISIVNYDNFQEFIEV